MYHTLMMYKLPSNPKYSMILRFYDVVSVTFNKDKTRSHIRKWKIYIDFNNMLHSKKLPDSLIILRFLFSCNVSA